MKRKVLFAVLFLMLVCLQTVWAQKMTLYMTGNQVAEYNLLQLDSIAFSENNSSGNGDTTEPSVTGDAIDVTNNTATLVGYATSIRDNLSTDLRVGFIYCLEGMPSKNNGTQVDVVASSVAENGRYATTISNLLSDATYYFRSFVYQSGIWFYGKVKSFITESIQVNITTGDATAITCFSAKVSGSVNVQSSYSSLTYGICYGTNIEPTTNDNAQTASSGSFTLQLRQLTGGTTYYYRPYAIVDGQTRYGTVRTFRTLDDNVVETGDIDEEALTVTSRLTIGGGAYSSLALGVCYGKMELPNVNNKTVTSNEVDDENNYTVKLVSPGVGTIYYRAYILIDGIPHYGAVKSFEREQVQAYVDLGLPSGTLWATCNVGASSPEEYGDYFAWGETEPKDTYNWSTYKYCNGLYNTITKYCVHNDYGHNGFTDVLTELLPADDAATANCGSGWQMPSLDQITELYDSNYTTTEWTRQNGINGMKITSNGNSNSIFLPAAGCRNDTSLNLVGSGGKYGSRSLDTGDSISAYGLSFGKFGINWSSSGRCLGFSVRPVRVHE